MEQLNSTWTHYDSPSEAQKVCKHHHYNLYPMPRTDIPNHQIKDETLLNAFSKTKIAADF